MSEATPPLSDVRKSDPSRKKLTIRLLLLAAVFGAGVYGVGAYRRMIEFEVTDDAAVAADVVQISSQIGGTVERILVSDNEAVKKGQVLAILDDSRVNILVQQARANLDSALADAKAAGADVRLTEKTHTADEAQASGGVQQAVGGVGVAESAVAKANADVAVARNAERMAANDVTSAGLEVQTARLGVERATQDVVSAQAGLDNAKGAMSAAESAAVAANLRRAEAARELNRQRKLFEEGAISGRQVELAETASADASAALEAARHQLDSAETTVRQRAANLESAKAFLRSTQNAVRDAEVRTKSANLKVESARVATQASETGLASAKRSLDVAFGRKRQSNGQLISAQAGTDRVEVKRATENQALARVEQARAALANVELDLRHTRILAPSDGRIAKRTIQVGSLVQQGSPAMTLVPSGASYIVANFKETQVARLEAGQIVDIEADGLPDHVFHGKVDSESAATGSTFALLPPDNATGNFVKVVQRVPVKILLDPKDAGAKRLHVGMSVTVRVRVK